MRIMSRHIENTSGSPLDLGVGVLPEPDHERGVIVYADIQREVNGWTVIIEAMEIDGHVLTEQEFETLESLHGDLSDLLSENIVEAAEKDAEHTLGY